MNEESLLNVLSTHHKRIQEAQRQETKDSILCQLVMLLRQFVPSQEARDKIEEILREYNSEERITHMKCICCTKEIPDNEEWGYATDYERELLVVGIIALPGGKLCEECAEELEAK